MTKFWDNHFDEIEKNAKEINYDDCYLWPRTPIGGDHQDTILKRVGARDDNMNNHNSRSFMITCMIKKIIKKKLLKNDFSILDIACGDALVLEQLNRTFPDSKCYGVDCNIDKFDTHDKQKKEGIKLYNAYIQQLYTNRPEKKIKITLMLNTYRGWESADLREHEKSLPEDSDKWFAENSEFSFITATYEQVKSLRKKGFYLSVLGKGEDHSYLVCISKDHKIPNGNLLHNLIIIKFLSLKNRFFRYFKVNLGEIN